MGRNFKNDKEDWVYVEGGNNQHKSHHNRNKNFQNYNKNTKPKEEGEEGQQEKK